jgi:hypothetical protein
MNDIDKILNKLNSNYGILIAKNDEIIYEKYVGNKSNTRFRIFSLSKPITAMAIFLLANEGKLCLTDTLDTFGINIPHSRQITINHLLYHASGVYDFSSELYFKLNPKELFDKICKRYETDFVEFKTCIDQVRGNEPYFKPSKIIYKQQNYNNTGYDILGWIIYKASGVQTDKFIRKYIFKPLKMSNSGFQHERHSDESIPYDNNGLRGIKEQQNWYCGNAYIVCSLQDYNKFMSKYETLLNLGYLAKYKKLYYFIKKTGKNSAYDAFYHMGGGDFNTTHKQNSIKYTPLSQTLMVRYEKKNTTYNIIVSENYRNKTGFFIKKYKIWNMIIDLMFEADI